MDLVPFERVAGIANRTGEQRDISAGNDLIDVAGSCSFDTLKATNATWFRGLSAYAFEAQLAFGFAADDPICDIEIPAPFDFPDTAKLLCSGVTLFQPGLRTVQRPRDGIGVSLEETDVGMKAPAIGLSFFSSDFDGDLPAKLDAVTVHF